MDQYIREHQNHIVIQKLRSNKRLTKDDFLALEKILWSEVGTKEDYEKEFGDTPLTLLVLRIDGLDPTAANEAFSEFLDDQNLYTGTAVRLEGSRWDGHQLGNF